MEQSRREMSQEADIFQALYSASSEDAVDKVFNRFHQIFGDDKNWYPLGGNESNFDVLENQQFHLRCRTQIS